MAWLADKIFFWRAHYRPPLTLRQRLLRVVLKTAFAVVGLSALATLSLRWIDPPTTSFMLQSAHKAQSEERTDFRLRHHWVDWKYIAPHAKVAVVAAEDQRFAEHPGFDIGEIAHAVHERVTSGRHRGASTISQQVAKNLFLWPGESFVRKGLEAWFTLMIEFFWSKQRVLEVYLNIAQFGDGVFGIEAASIQYFHKTADALTPREAATLAAVLPSPVRYRVDRPSEYIKSRSDWILSQIEMLGGTAYVKEVSD